MNVKSILIPPKGAEKLASRLDPPEYGTVGSQSWVQDIDLNILMGILYLWHTSASRDTSSVDFG